VAKNFFIERTVELSEVKAINHPPSAEESNASYGLNPNVFYAPFRCFATVVGMLPFPYKEASGW